MIYIANDPGPGFHVNFAANALGCEPQPLRVWVLNEVNAVRRIEDKPPVSTRAGAYKDLLAIVLEYGQIALGTTKLDADKVIEPVLARVLIKAATRQAVAA